LSLIEYTERRRMTPARLKASRDEMSGEVYVPPRRFASDGSLRECVPCEVPAEGTLVSWTAFQGEFYGLVDLADGIRVQTLLGPGPHEAGQPYVGATDGAAAMRFQRA
jgi:uncharacterized OB-fold protein